MLTVSLFHAAVLSLILCMAYRRRQEFDTVTKAIVASGWSLIMWHYATTGWQLYSQDSAGHINYIHSIARSGWRPPLDADSIARHPPGYYMFAGAIYALAEKLGAAQPLHYVRPLSLLCYALFQYFCLHILALQLNEAPRRYYYLAVLLLVFWPVGLAIPLEINNDVALYPCFAAAILYLLRWQRGGGTEDMRRAFISIALAFFMKNNALILVFALGAVALLNYRRFPWRALSRPAFLCVYAFAFPLLAMGLGYNFLLGGGQTYLLSKPVGDPVAGAALAGYSFDLPVFLRYDFLDDFKIDDPDLTTVYNFPNYYLKTMLLGEYSWGSHAAVAALLWLFLPIILLMSVGGVGRGDPVSRAIVLSSIISVVAFRITYQTAQTQDFRYCYPILPLLLVWVSQALLMMPHRALQHLCESAVLLFAALCITFQLAQCLHYT